MDATAQAELVRTGELCAIDLVEAAIETIETRDVILNAVVIREFERALAVASKPLPTGPFSGVPFLLKDMLAGWQGVRLSFGSRLAGDGPAIADSELVKRLQRSGLVLLGRTNSSEFGLLPTTEPLRYGPTRNPWNPELSAGGSSGGAAAAVASGMVPMAHASDGGGSIRIPASCCGLFGLKPTRARNPLGPMLGDVLNGLVVEHALTRSVRDSAALLDATAGPDCGAPYWAAPPGRPFATEVGADPGILKIGVTWQGPGGEPLDPEAHGAIAGAAELCEQLGHRVDESAPEYDHELALEQFIVVWAAGCADLAETYTLQAHDTTDGTVDVGRLEPFTQALYEVGSRLRASEYLRAVHGLQRTGRQLASFFEHYDLWLTPVVTRSPPPLGYFDSRPGDLLEPLRLAGLYVPYAPLANVGGQPAMSVPLHWSADGLPIGAHFVARYGDEATLLRLASQFEQARPWAHRLPVVAPGACR